jgi:hypothetical protein
VSAVIAAALVGGPSTGRAATSFAITLSPLIGTAEVNEIPQVSYGGRIGYHVFVQNSGDSSTQHASVVVTSNLATFSDSDDASCVLNSKNSHQMICTPFGGTFVPGAIFEANLRFTAPLTGPAAGEVVSTSAAITVAAQSVGGNKNKGTTIATSDPVPTNVVENTSKADTFLHAKESAATSKVTATHGQNFGLTLPDALFGDPFGIALSIHDITGPQLCGTCVFSYTQLSIPDASLVTAPGNPFYNGTANPYSWTMSAHFVSPYKFNAVVHVDDNGVLHNLVTCQSLVGGKPTADEPMCYDADSLDTTQGNFRTISVEGKGIENGNIGFG